MGQFKTYVLHELLAETPHSQIYRAQSQHCTVVLKLLKKIASTPRRLATFKREYEIARKLGGIPDIIQVLSLEENDNHQWGIAFEDIGGSALSLLNLTGRLAIPDFLRLAMKMSILVSQIHDHNITHKDINPSNFVLNPSTDQLQIIDFGIASELAQEPVEIGTVQNLEGTLAYIAPEQTGRMNWGIDYRADLYSLGVSFYELLVGVLPFAAYADPLELVHAHLAQLPVPPHIVKPEIPEMLSRIVAKLMNKDPSQRYQSAAGVTADLEMCLQFWNAQQQIPFFDLTQHDVSRQFRIPEKRYGREHIIEQLKSAFESACTGRARIVLVVGEPGIGKTSVAQELCNVVSGQQGYFVEGKYDPLQKDIPYSALLQALHHLIRQILAEGDRMTWKKRLQVALGNIGQVIIDILPDLELIIGSQPALRTLSPTETQTRFNLAFQNFLGALSGSLVLFLDDLQWADLPSLNLLEALLTLPDLNGLLLVGAYRENDIEGDHPLIRSLGALSNAGVPIQTLTVKPLLPGEVGRMVADTLLTTVEQSQPIAQIVYSKTLGNPFFVRQFLISLHQRDLIRFDNTARRWIWQQAEILALQVTDNVADLMRQKIAQLPEQTQQALRTAAVIGTLFSLKALAQLLQMETSQLAQTLWLALVEQLIYPIGTAYKFAALEIGAEDDITYRFAHDRIQQAAYELLLDTEARYLHWRLGWQLWDQYGDQRFGVQVFEIANHLNAGQVYLQTELERERLFEINQKAAQRAMISAAYSVALLHVQKCLALLGEKAWQDRYEITLDLHTQAALAAILSSDAALMQHYIDTALQKARRLLDKIAIYKVLLSHLALANAIAAVETALQVLAALGEVYPSAPTPSDVRAEFERTMALLRTTSFDALRQLPPMTDATRLAVMQILATVPGALFETNVPLFNIIHLKQIQATVQYGNSPLTPYLFQILGSFLCGTIGDIESGYRYGQFGLELMAQSPTTYYVGNTYVVALGFIQHWKEPVREVLDKLGERGHLELEAGNIVPATYSYSIGYTQQVILGTVALPLATERLLASRKFAERHHDLTGLQHTLDILRMVDDLTTPSHSAHKTFRAESTLEGVLSDSAWFAVAMRWSVAYTFQDHEYMQRYMLLAKRYEQQYTGLAAMWFYVFLESMTMLALYADAAPLDTIEANQHKIAAWMHHAPMNLADKWHLVEAERARIVGKTLEAAEHYDKAIAAAHANGFIREEAAANQYAGGFYLAQGRDKLASAYLQEAYIAYQQWGALGKAAQIAEQYPQFFGDFLMRLSSGTTSTSITQLDTLSIARVFQALAQEIELDSLLKKLMVLTIENAGAQQGCLIINRGNTLLVEAALMTGETEIQLVRSCPLQDATKFPVAPEIVQYVAQTRESVVLDNALQSPSFSRTPYIQATQPRSVLCMPLINQAQLVGIIYLENNLAERVFTRTRIETIGLLSTQMAIALINATLYSDLQHYQEHLEEMVSFRTRDLEVAAEVSRKITTLLNFEELLRQLVAEVKEAFDLYDVAIFLYSEADQTLQPSPSGRQSFSLQARGIVPMAARARQYNLVNEVSASPDYVPNPDLPQTHAELALPMVIGTKLIGVLDLHANTAARFTESDIKVLTSLSEQFAIAIENTRLYAEQAQMATLRERERVARDMHDSLGHALAAILIQLEAVQRLCQIDPSRASAQIDELKTLTRSSMQELRRSLAGLRAPGLGDRQLRQAISELCHEASIRTGLKIDCQIAERSNEFGLILAETIWRIIQEALTNIEKHAQATQVSVIVKIEHEFVVVQVADNGIGVSSQAIQSNRFGLRGMQERIEGLGGTFYLKSQGGTTLEARLPWIGGR